MIHNDALKTHNFSLKIDQIQTWLWGIVLQKQWRKFNTIPASNLSKPHFNTIAIIFLILHIFQNTHGVQKKVEGRFWTNKFGFFKYNFYCDLGSVNLPSG